MDKVEERLKCGICLDRYRQPKMLPCQHTFCLQCLRGLLLNASHQFDCPECRASHRVPHNRADGFPTNITIQQFLDICGVSSSSSDSPPNEVPPNQDSFDDSDFTFVNSISSDSITSPNSAEKWVRTCGRAELGRILSRAFAGGHDHGGTILYVGRANLLGALVPGKVQPEHGVCYVASNGREHGIPVFEVYVGSGTWAKTSGSNIPPEALFAGTSDEGEPLFVGRAPHNGTMTIGQVSQSQGCCFIPYDGKEIRKTEYEVLLC